MAYPADVQMSGIRHIFYKEKFGFIKTYYYICCSISIHTP